MRESGPSVALQAQPSLARGGLARELARAAAAAGIYLLLRPVWEWIGLREVYRAIVIGTAERVVVATQHFPLLSSLSNLTTRNIDFVVLLAVGLVLVSTRIGWRRRLRLFGAALAVVLTIQILAFVLWVKMTAAQELASQQQILILLPWEFRVVDRLKYLLYDFGQPAMMFALLLSTLVWNSGLTLGTPLRSRPEGAATPGLARRSRRWIAIGLGVAVAAVAIAGWAAWRRSREGDPRHVQAHAKIGHLFWRAGDRATAEEQYRLAVSGGTEDPEVFYNLAGVAASRGRLVESRRLLAACSELTEDPAWTARIRRAQDAVRAPRSGLDPPR